MNGAKVVARAWVDPVYRERLLTDGTAAIAELGFSGPEGDHMVVVETHHRAQRGGLHPVLVLPVAGSRPSRRTGTRAHRTGLGWCASREWSWARWAAIVPRTCEIRVLGLVRRGALSRPAHAPGRFDDLSEDELAGVGHQGRHDRRGAARL